MIIWVKLYVSQTESIFLEVCWLSMFKLKSPDIMISDMPVSTARAIEY